ncbi:MAG: cytochrome P450, partial [Methylobacter sp.]
MPQNKPIPKIKGEFLLGNLRQMKANPFQALCEWQHDYGDLASFRLATRHFYLISHPKLVEQALIKQSDIFVKMYDPKNRGVAIFAKAFMGIPAQQAAKTTRPLMPAAAPAVLLHSLDTQQGASNIFLAMTRRDVGK